MNEESVSRTLLIAALVALFCSALVAGAVHILRPIQQALTLLERNSSILQVAGRLPEAGSDRDRVNAYLALDARLLDLTTDRFAQTVPGLDPASFDHWALTADSEYALPLTVPTANSAGLTWVPRYVPVYLVWGAAGLERLVLPIHGTGMWSTLQGHLALKADFNTIAALHIFRHGETPGIGDRIQDPTWEASWAGRRAYDLAGDVAIRVGRADTADGTYRVDLISGASVTSMAVGDLVRFWLGPAAYGPWLQRLRQGSEQLFPTDGGGG